MQQEYPPPHPHDNQQRIRRTQRYESQEQQESPPPRSFQSNAEPQTPKRDPQYRQPSADDFPERPRSVYQARQNQPINSQPLIYQEQLHPTNNYKTKKKPRNILVWAIVAIVIVVIVGIGSNGYQNNDAKTRPDRSLSAQTSVPSQTQTAAPATASPTIAPSKSPTNTPTAILPVYETLSQGSSGTKVKTLQQRLIQLGYLHDTADGIFGSKTLDAVSAYQIQNNIIATGIADSNTLSSLYSASAKEATITATAYPDTTKYTATLTTGQRNALSSAKAYLSFTAFSYNSLIDQLEYEKYSHADAVYAADHCEANWNEQALKSAKNYLSFTAFSYKGLIEQLEYEQFTNKQATYAADNCGANWNEQAARSAKNYLSFTSFSRDGLIDQLEYEGFTHKQAVYGASANGY